jgi:hypothetical protein
MASFRLFDLDVLTLNVLPCVPTALLMPQRLGCNAELIVDEFGEKLLEELDYLQVGRLVCGGTLSQQQAGGR